MEYRNLYKEWQDALSAPAFDADKLAEIHRLYQARLRNDAEQRARWEVADRAWREERAAVEQRVRGELTMYSKSVLRRRFEERNGWAPEPGDRLWTKERYIEDEVMRAQGKVKSVHARLKESV